MRTVFIVSYDVSDAKRLRLTHKTLTGFGTALQYSVFRCELNPLQLHALKEKLWAILNLNEDRVMVVDLGPAGARGDHCVQFWGTSQIEPAKRNAVIV